MRDLAVTHSCILSLALLTPFTLSPSVDVFFAFRMIQTALMGQYVLLHPRANSKLQTLLKGTPLRRIFFCTSWDDLQVALQCFKHSQAVCVRFCHIANFQPKFYLGSTSSFVLDRKHSRYRKFHRCNRTNSYWPKLPYGFGVDTTTSGCGLFSQNLHQKIQFLGFGTSLNSTVATSIEYSVYLSVFQLPKGTHPSDQVLEFTSVWILLVVAQTTMEVNPCTSTSSSSQSNIWSPSSTLGNHPRPWEQFCQTISHGEATSLQRDRPTRMLLHSTTCQQPWRTSTFLCHQCHRSSPDLLESQTSPQTRSASSTLAPGYRLDSSSTTTSYHPRTPDQAVQHHSSDSFHRHCIHQISLGHGQPMQSQRSSYSVGRRRDSDVCMSSSPTTFTFTLSSRPTSRS